MITLEDITVLNDIQAWLARVTPEQVQAAGRRLDPDDTNPVIGVIESETTRALYTLSVMLSAEEALEEAKAKGATDEMIENDHMERAAVLDMLRDVVRMMFFSQAKTDLGFNKKEGVGLRSGWVLIKAQPQGPRDILRMLSGG